MGETEKIKERCRALLLEDNDDEAELVERALRKIDPKPVLSRARSAVEAQKYLNDLAACPDRTLFPLPHIILVDVRLGPESGLDFVWWCKGRAQFASISVVVFTGSNYPQALNTARNSGADAVEHKPVAFNELITIVQRIVKRWCDPALEVAFVA